MLKCSRFVQVFGALAGFAVVSSAAPVLWEGNGHYYEVVRTETAINWFDAQAGAASRSHLGGQGYLVTITSAAENQWLVDTFGDLLAGDRYGTWIGGYKIDRTLPANEGWTWVTGEEWSYTNWHAPEPSNSFGTEDGLQFKWTNTGAMVGQWNDADRFATYWESSYRADFLGYVVEYEAVPEPMPMTLLGVGALALLRRKKSA